MWSWFQGYGNTNIFNKLTNSLGSFRGISVTLSAPRIGRPKSPSKTAGVENHHSGVGRGNSDPQASA